METAGASRVQETRAGARVLALLAVPLNGLILRALGKGPISQAGLRKELGNPAQTTLRGYLGKLEDLGAMRRPERSTGAYTPDYELTETGEGLLVATRALEGWLKRAPQGPVPLGSEPAKGAVRALAGAWESTLLRALAGAPLSLTQLDSLIGFLSYPALERRLSAMRAAGLAMRMENGRDRTPYTVTPWARQSVGLIASAAQFERRHMGFETPRLASIDIEAAFLLATPIASLPADADGVCDLVAETGNGSRRLAGVHVAVDRGKIASCVSRLDESPKNWALGSTIDWLEALVDQRPEQLRIGGDRHLASSLVCGLHELLFAS
jgi:DNA-binding HxlR family transcriptional regulator